MSKDKNEAKKDQKASDGQKAVMRLGYSLQLRPDNAKDKFDMKSIRTPSLIKSTASATIPEISDAMLNQIDAALVELSAKVDERDTDSPQVFVEFLDGLSAMIVMIKDELVKVEA